MVFTTTISWDIVPVDISWWDLVGSGVLQHIPSCTRRRGVPNKKFLKAMAYYGLLLGATSWMKMCM